MSRVETLPLTVIVFSWPTTSSISSLTKLMKHSRET